MAAPIHDRAAALEARLHLEMLPQPDDFTCGPTCLHAVYRYWGDDLPLQQVIDEVSRTASGGTADVYLAVHALKRGYRATIHTYNVRIFDPTWFGPEAADLAAKLRQQAEAKADQTELVRLTQGYLEFLRLGGTLRFVDLGAAVIRRPLRRGVPVLTGLSATYLYRRPRERGPDDVADDVRGEPQGHFVVLCGYRPQTQSVMVADPFAQNPLAPARLYEVGLERVVGAILLGVLTHDANLLTVEPARRRSARRTS